MIVSPELIFCMTFFSFFQQGVDTDKQHGSWGQTQYNSTWTCPIQEWYAHFMCIPNGTKIPKVRPGVEEFNNSWSSIFHNCAFTAYLDLILKKGVQK